MKQVKPFLVLVIVFTTALGAPQLAKAFTNRFDFSGIDPDHAFMWITVHHLVQAFIVLIIIAIIIRFTSLSFPQFGLQVGDKKRGLRYVKIFSLGFLVYAIVSIFMVLFLNTFNTFPYPLSFRNIAGQLGFQLLLSGPSEELIFRAFSMTLLSLFISVRILGQRFSVANLIAAFLFVLAHIGITWAPLSFSYDSGQLIYVFVLGVVYGDCFEKTKSVYYPMLLHSISNVISVSLMVFASVMIG